MGADPAGVGMKASSSSGTWWRGRHKETGQRRARRARGRSTEDEAGREGEGARGLLELQAAGEEAGDADDGVEAQHGR